MSNTHYHVVDNIVRYCTQAHGGGAIDTFSTLAEAAAHAEPEAGDPFEDQPHVEDCPLCGTEQPVVEFDEMPSMLGYGCDEAITLGCGHVLTFDPFTGKASAR